MPIPTLILIAGSLASFALIFVGAKLRYSQAHSLIAGYNTASREEKAKYDIEGLSHHIGNGLMTMGVLLIVASVFASMDNLAWSLGSMGLFVLVAFLIVLGGRKFLPNAPRPGDHRFLKSVLPERAFHAVRNGTKQWLLECPCGHLSDLWERGGVRYKAAGEPRQWIRCPACEKPTWHKVRRKTATEQKQVA